MSDSETSDFRSGRTISLKNRLLMTAVGVLFVGTALAGILSLHSRANAERPPDPFPPITVQTHVIDVRNAYFVKERFVGLLEPARQTRLAFERPGLVTEILFDEGSDVAQGAVVARLDTLKLVSERRGLEARRQELKARYDLASVTLSRQKSLKAKGWQSDQKYDEARYAAAQLQSAMKSIEASIASIDVDIAKSELRAPFAGTVAGRMIDEGSVVSPGTAIVDLMESKARRARVGVSAEAASGITRGSVHQLASDNISLNGVLISKRPDLELRSRTVTLLFEVVDAADIRFGEMVELIVEREIPSRGAWIPLSALTEDAKGLWSVFTVAVSGSQSSVTRESVEVLHVDDQRVYVRGDLPDNRSVIINGTNRVIAGQKVFATSEQGDS